MIQLTHINGYPEQNHIAKGTRTLISLSNLGSGLVISSHSSGVLSPLEVIELSLCFQDCATMDTVLYYVKTD